LHENEFAGAQQRGFIVTFHSLVRGASAVLASLILGSCGGGGAVTDPNRGGDFDIQPDGGTFFAGTVNRITISGGRMPYTLTSSDPSIFDVPAIVNQHFIDVVPNNPGIIDQGLPADALPIVTINVIARDSQGLTQTAAIKVAHNFLTGYFIGFTPSNCPAGADACSGGETVVTFDTITNGVRYGNRPFVVSIVKGGCLLENPIGSNNLTTSVPVGSDHEGKVTVVMHCASGVAPGVGVIRIQDAGTGANTEHAFTIASGGAGSGLTVIPDTVDFIGVDSATCGTGDSEVLVFGGQPPYTARSTTAGITVTPSSNTQPGEFTVSVHGAIAPCPTGPVVITDANLQVATVDVKSEPGQGAPPPAPSPPLTATPAGVTLTCGQSQSVLVTGGTGGALSAVSNNPKVTAAVAANTVTITRAPDALNPAGSTQSMVSVTDGTNIVNIPVNNPLTCT